MFIFHKKYALIVNLPGRHHTCSLPFSPSFRVADPIRASCPDLPHGPVGSFFIFLVDRFHSVTAQCTFTPGAISQAFSSKYNIASSAEHLCSDCHGCGY
ncbi:unnamed protein product [Protopolystoma xenopodis]|uniref:Uncharacterized protein n=1 Tax=Protopolystoma xenopodis TaxID=117903 RepID=A0A3S5FBX5_9PLAT|nr:unnamed protein product [Protopolystoma xenopodis]